MSGSTFSVDPVLFLWLAVVVLVVSVFFCFLGLSGLRPALPFRSRFAVAFFFYLFFLCMPFWQKTVVDLVASVILSGFHFVLPQVLFSACYVVFFLYLCIRFRINNLNFLYYD